jgi:hypothetical protein
MGYAVAAHQFFRGSAVDQMTFVRRSYERFWELYHKGGQSQHLRQELQKLLFPRQENIALVVAQGALALLVRCNAQAILNMAKEVPEEWMRIVLAADGDMFIGAAT